MIPKDACFIEINPLLQRYTYQGLTIQKYGKSYTQFSYYEMDRLCQWVCTCREQYNNPHTTGLKKVCTTLPTDHSNISPKAFSNSSKLDLSNTSSTDLNSSVVSGAGITSPVPHNPATPDSKTVQSHTVSTKLATFSCPHCSKVYTLKTSLYKHLRNHHQGLHVQLKETTIKCNKCSLR